VVPRSNLEALRMNVNDFVKAAGGSAAGWSDAVDWNRSMRTAGESRTRLLWVGGSIVTIAVVLLTIIQYRLLTRLREAALDSRARQAEVVADEIASAVSHYFGVHADASLDVSGAELTNDAALVTRFRKSDFRGAREFFVVRPAGTGRMRILFVDGRGGRMVERPRAASIAAIEFAMYAWSSPERRHVLRQPRLSALGRPRSKERAAFINLDIGGADRENRIALHPIGVGDDFAGATGFIIDHRYVLDILVPSLIERSLRDPARKGLRAAVRQTASMLPEPPAPRDERVLAQEFLRFGMRDFVIEIYGEGVDPALVASRSFYLNVALMIVIAVNAVIGAMLTIRAAHAQMRLATMKSDFISTVTHELRTPLSSIRLFARLIRTGTSSSERDEAATYATHIEDESERLSQMVEHVLDLSRIESAAEKPRTVLDLRSAVRAAVLRHARLLRSRGLEVDCSLPDGPVLVDGHADTLTSAVSNLIENAINYSGETGAPIEVEVRTLADTAEIVVRDRGIGIAPHDRDRIFDRFYRAGADAVQRVHGTGLGLAIVKSAVEAHGGHVEASGRRGGGTEFTIRLPRRVQEDATRTPNLVRGSA
jgi:signal transduction histidine kinase